MISVLEKISQNVLTTLQNVTTANGYDYTISPIRAGLVSSPNHLEALIYQVSPEQPSDGPARLEEWVQLYAVVVYVMPYEADTTPIDVYNNAISGAMHKELMKDYTRGGLAIDTTILPTIYFPPYDSETAGIVFNFSVRYWTVIDDPFTSPVL